MASRSGPPPERDACAANVAGRIAYGQVAGRRIAVVALAGEPASMPAAHSLTAAEADVAARLLRGESYAAIAAARGTSARTVANQARRVLEKVGAGSRFELARKLRGDAG